MSKNIIDLYPGQWGRPAIVQAAEEHDRKECIALDQKVDGANRELAQWLWDHKIYTAPEVAKWLGCGESRIKRLRKWAQNGFVTATHDSRDAPHNRSEPTDEPLKTKDNFTDTPKPDEDDDEDGFGGVEDPAAIVDNVLGSISGAKSLFEAWRKTFTASAFDCEQKAQLYNAINLLIAKLRKVQSTLDTKGRGYGQSKDN